MATIEQVKMFQKLYFTIFAKHTFQQCGLRQPYFFCALVLKQCNGSMPCEFSESTIHYELERNCFPIFMWYKNVFKDIGQELYQIDSRRALKLKTKQPIKQLIDAVTCITCSCKNYHCLSRLQHGSFTEEEIKCILALHYFKPLANDAPYYVDKIQGHQECLCHMAIKADYKRSTFGNSSVWHGHSDIFVKKSIVKVEKHVDLTDTCPLEDEEGHEYYCSKTKKLKTEDTEKRLKSCSIAIAQAMVNAFVESGKDDSLFDKFVPSYLATEKNVRIILYNCKLDKLLISDELPIWDQGGNLCYETMIFIWVAMNSYVNEIDDTTKHLLKKTPESRFQDVVGEEYGIYLNSVTRPVTCTPTCMKCISLNEPIYNFFEKGNVEYILENCVELFQDVSKAAKLDPV